MMRWGLDLGPHELSSTPQCPSGGLREGPYSPLMQAHHLQNEYNYNYHVEL